MTTSNMNLVIIVFCLMMSAFFSAAETSFSTSNKIRLKSMSDKGNKRAALALHLIENFDSLISSILIGNNIVNILSASLTTVLFIEWLGEARGPSASTAVTTIVVLIFGEVTPKSIAKEFPESFAMFASPFLRFLMFVLTPFNWLFKQWKKILSMVLKAESNLTITEEELLTFVEETANDGTIDEEESGMIRTIIKFSDLEAMDILTPMIDVTTASIDMKKEQITDIFVESGYSRLPVYEENINNIIGTLYQKDYFSQVYLGGKDVREVLKPAKFVYGNKKIRELLNELKEEQTHIAIVTSEYGSILGIITLEDILEELVGEIWDEGDEKKEEFVRLPDGSYEFLGMTGVHKIIDEFQLDPDTIHVTTVNGWIIGKLNKIPVSGEKFEDDSFRYEILSMNKNRIDKVKVERKQKEEIENE